MCWFFKKKKKNTNNVSQTPKEVITSKEKVEVESKETIKPEDKPAESKQFIMPKSTEKTVKNDHVVKQEPTKTVESSSGEKPLKPIPSVNKTQNKPSSKAYQGKYEVFQEAGSYKYRLKASNGEVLAVSLRYTTEKGAFTGIETFKKNVENGVFEVYTDKSGFSQYHLYTANKARVIMVGEFYPNEKQAESAVESVKKFFNTERIDTIAKLPDDEVREELVEYETIAEVATGKYEIYSEEKAFLIRLKANNAQVLFVSQGYYSKASAKQGLETIKTAIGEKRFTVSRDKQNRYQFNLYSATNQLILTGETYPVKSSCISAINSVRKFGLKAKVVEL